MKILHINYYDLKGGAAKAAYRLHRGLIRAGQASEMLVAVKDSDDPDVTRIPSAFRRFPGLKQRIALGLSKLQVDDNFHPRSMGIFPSGLVKYINSRDADIVHLHWCCGEMISIGEIAGINHPMVWTLHDCWPIAGAGHHWLPGDAARVKEGYLRGNRNHETKGLDVDRWIWQLKNRAWSTLDVMLVSPTRWLDSLVAQSRIFAEKPHMTIHHGIDLNIFHPRSKARIRMKLGIPDNKLVLGFSSASLSDPNKGFQYLPEIISEIPAAIKRNLQIVLWGKADLKISGSIAGVPAMVLGQIAGEENIADIYCALDCFVNCSARESFCLAIAEALACGIPCIAFNVCGISELIVHNHNGYLVRPFECNDFAEGVKWVLAKNNYNELCLKARKIAEEKFDIRNIVRQYITLYNGILGK